MARGTTDYNLQLHIQSTKYERDPSARHIWTQIEDWLLPFLLPGFRAGNLHVCRLWHSAKCYSPEYHSLQWLSIPNSTQSIRMQAILRQVYITTVVFQMI